MDTIYKFINQRAEQHIPKDIPFPDAFPDYTDWCVIWYRVAEDIRDEFLQDGLTESAAVVEAIILKNLGSSWHNTDRDVILAELKHNYNF